MTNKHASKQHGLVGNIRPKSKNSKRVNKEKARERKKTRVVQMNTLINEAAKK